MFWVDAWWVPREAPDQNVERTSLAPLFRREKITTPGFDLEAEHATISNSKIVFKTWEWLATQPDPNGMCKSPLNPKSWYYTFKYLKMDV